MMQYFFDTCSLVTLARYFHPFEQDGQLTAFLESKFKNGEIVILDEVFNESRLISQGIALKTFPFFEKHKDLVIDTKDLMPFSAKKFDNLLSNNFMIASLVKHGHVDIATVKQTFLNSGDGKLILTMYNRLHERPDAEVCIVTEESRMGNDRKPIKKIPAICDIIHARSMSLVDYLLTTTLKITL